MSDYILPRFDWKAVPSAENTSVVDTAIASRKSIRKFLPTPIARQTIEDILRLAARAPSGTNTQPWFVHVLEGAARERLSAAILREYNDAERCATHVEEYAYYPRQWEEPYLSRRRKIGWDLYGLLGIDKADKERMHTQHGRNYIFFDAPIGLIFTIDRVMAQGSWLDFGMFLQNIMIAARARGLHTCPQAAITQFHRVIAAELPLPDRRMVVCGMALGHADPDAVENSLVSERAPLSSFVQFLK